MASSTFAKTRCWTSYRWQMLAAFFCLLFGAAMIANISLGGEASWFWYATLMHHGTKLYADMHSPLQPFYALETDAWLQLVGRSCLADEVLALLHVLVLLSGMGLVLRESTWADWRKAAVLAAGFFTDIYFLAIRFDDFHVVNDIFVIYTLVVLLRLYHARSTGKELLWTVVTGVLCGLAFTNRSTDGGMLLLAAGFCVPFIAQRQRLLATVLYALAMATTILFVVHLTGDTLHDYLTNSIFHAASAKGGSATVLHGPFLAVMDNLRHLKDLGWVAFILIFFFAAYAKRRWGDNARVVFPAALGFGFFLAAAMALRTHGVNLTQAHLIVALNLIEQNLIYPASALVLLHFFLSRRRAGSTPWDRREILLFIPAAVLVSAAVSQATGTFNSTISLTLIFLLSSLWLPSYGKHRWLSDAWVAIAIIIACAGLIYKTYTPYFWGTYKFKPLFVGRQVYHHPVYGWMYLQTDMVQFIEPICKDIEQPDGRPAELLSMPYSYPNYFCATPPWNGYVQTWFDTTTPDQVQTLMKQLNSSPPQWIIYERQLAVLRGHELEYNGGRPIMHRKLDELITAKIASGQWKIVDERDYPDGIPWYVIRTRP